MAVTYTRAEIVNGTGWAADARFQVVTTEAEPEQLAPIEALKRIAACLSGREWNADTFDAIVGILEDAGYTIEDSDPDGPAWEYLNEPGMRERE